MPPVKEATRSLRWPKFLEETPKRATTLPARDQRRRVTPREGVGGLTSCHEPSAAFDGTQQTQRGNWNDSGHSSGARLSRNSFIRPLN